MDYNMMLKLQQSWGKKPCNHPRMEKVYYAGTYLTNYACTQCGAEFTIIQKLEIDAKKKALRKSSLL